MTRAEGGSAVLIERPGHGKTDRGPFDFVADELRCGASVYVACVQLSGAQATFTNVTFKFPRGTVHEAVYHLASGSRASFDNDAVDGYGKRGALLGGSAALVSGGRWTPG